MALNYSLRIVLRYAYDKENTEANELLKTHLQHFTAPFRMASMSQIHLLAKMDLQVNTWRPCSYLWIHAEG